MQSKRGQLTVFVIIGIVIVTGIVLVLFLRNGYFDNSSIDDERVKVLRDNTLDCMNNVYLDSLIFIGFQGGYFNVTGGVYNGFVSVPYYYKQGSLNVLTVESVEGEIEDYLDAALVECFGYQENILSTDELNLTRVELLGEDFSGYDVFYSDFKTDVEIKETEVLFTTDVDLKVVNPEGRTSILRLKNNPQVIESQLFDMLNLAEYIANSLYEEDESVCLTCVYTIASEKDLYVDFMGYLSPEDELVIISNNATSVPFVFQFLNKYLEAEENEEEGLF